MADGRGSSVGLAISPGLVSSTSSDHSDGLMSPSHGLDQDNKPKHKFNPSAASFVPGHGQPSIDDLLARIPKSRHSPSSKGKKQRHLRNGATPSPCVWVGNVSPSLSEQEFRAEFERYGAVNNIRMFPSSKCAFVTFAKAKYAVRALDLEGKQLGGMRLTLNPGTASRHLWVGNVGPDVTDSALHAAFSVYGPVESVRILRSNRCAFVNFIDDKDALAAAENMNGMQLGEMQLSINFQWPDHGKRAPRGAHPHGPHPHPHHPHSSAHGRAPIDHRGAMPPPPHDPRYSPVHHLDHSIPELTASMHALGMSMHMPMPGPVHEPADPFSAAHSPNPPFSMQLQPPPNVGVSPYPLQQQSAQTVPARQLFVGNLAGSISESVLWGLFSPFGDVEKVKYFPARGYAFVVFRNTQDAIWAREQMIKYPPFIAERVLVVNFGKPDDAEQKARDHPARNPLEPSGSHSSLNGSINGLLDPAFPYDLSRRPSHAHSVLSAASAAAAAAAAVLHTPSASERGSPITHPRSPPPHESLEHAAPHDPDHFGSVFLPPRPDHLHAPPALHYGHAMVFHPEDRDHRIDAGFGMPMQFYDQGPPLGMAIPPRPLPIAPNQQRSYSAAVANQQI